MLGKKGRASIMISSSKPFSIKKQSAMEHKAPLKIW